MNNEELRRLLAQFRTPAPPPEYWENFPIEIAGMLEQESVPAPHPVAPSSFFNNPAIFGAAVFAAVVVIVCLIIVTTRKSSSVSANNLAEMREYLRQVELVFPHQISAIVFDAHGAHLLLADKPDVPTSSALLLNVCNNAGCQSIVTFSGQEIPLAGQNVSVLSEPGGQPILCGDKLLWSERVHIYPGTHWKIQARSLGAIEAKG